MKFYRPKGDSYAEKAVYILIQSPEQWMGSGMLSELIGCTLTALPGVLEYAIRNEWIRVEKREGKNFYAIGAAAPPVGTSEPSARMLPATSVFDLGAQQRAMPTSATFGIWPDGRINIQRGGRTTEQLSPSEAQALDRALQARRQAAESAKC